MADEQRLGTGKMKTLLSILLLLLGMADFSAIASASCDSINASHSGGWMPVSTAPRDGRSVEMMETFGVAPWYGRFRWTNEILVGTVDGKTVKAKSGRFSWTDADGKGVSEDACLFWRPTKSTGKYVDPTGGAQDSVAYWCAAMHRPYDKKTDTCK